MHVTHVFPPCAAAEIISAVFLGVSLAIASPLAYTASMGRPSDLSGIAAMLAATASFVIGDSFMKLATEDLPPFEVLFLRSIAASLACAVLVVLRGEWRAISGALDVPRSGGRPGKRSAPSAMSWPLPACRSPMRSPSSRRGR